MPVNSEDAVARIKARLDLVDVVSEQVKLRRQGRELVGLCPFHQEDSPSFSVNPQTQFWYCFGCQKGGDLFEFVEQIEKTDFPGALQILADRTGVELGKDRLGADRQRLELKRRILKVNELAARYYEYVLHATEAGRIGLELLQRREVGEETARRFQLGYAPGGASLTSYLTKREVPIGDAVAAGLVRSRAGERQDFFSRRLVIPIRDERGQPLAFTGRTVDEDVKAKYVNTQETPVYVKGRVLFALDLARKAIEERGHAVLMEGQFDVIAGHQFGIENAVASSGTALTEEQVKLLKRFTEEVVLAFDDDQAGRGAAFRAIETASGLGLRTRVVRGTGAKDPDEFLRSAGADAPARWAELTRRAPQGWEFWLRESIAGLNPSNPREVEVALGRMRGVLARIGDAALQEVYRRRAAEWLDIEPRFLASRPSAGGGKGAGKGSIPSPGPLPGGLGPRPAGKRMTAGLLYLLQVLAVRPELAAKVRAQLDPAELGEVERPTYLRMLEAIDRGGLEALSSELTTFDETEQDLIRRAWASPPPSVADEVVDSVVRKLKRGALEVRLKQLRGEILEAERQGDARGAQDLHAAHSRVSQDLEAMKLKPRDGFR
ncbi:MAG: DNA primase [Candidatus Dormibacteraceae bacterium]